MLTEKQFFVLFAFSCWTMPPPPPPLLYIKCLVLKCGIFVGDLFNALIMYILKFTSIFFETAVFLF